MGNLRAGGMALDRAGVRCSCSSWLFLVGLVVLGGQSAVEGGSVLASVEVLHRVEHGKREGGTRGVSDLTVLLAIPACSGLH